MQLNNFEVPDGFTHIDGTLDPEKSAASMTIEDDGHTVIRTNNEPGGPWKAI